MRLELVRLFLSPRPQKDVFERKNADGSDMSREQWLRDVFTEQIDFVHQRAVRYYVPDATAHKEHRIVARIGRQSISRENDPDNYLHEMEREQWKACLIIIDPTAHDDGQKVAIEVQRGSFTSFEALINLINSRTPPEPYAIELNSITEETSFWEYIEFNKGAVTSITLEIATPNMFGGGSSFEEDAKRLRDKEKARKIKETIENPDGLEPETDRMHDAVSYVSRGGGRVRAKSKDAHDYDSTDNKKYVYADIDKSEVDVDRKTAAALDALSQSDEQTKSAKDLRD